MKTCQHCEGFILYEDSLSTCPRCGKALNLYVRKPRLQIQDSDQTPVGAQAGGPVKPTTTSPDRPVFETIEGHTHQIEGLLAEVAPITRYQTRGHKLVNALFRGEPYQLGHSTHSVRMRVEEHRDHGFPEQVRDIIALGDFEGKLLIGSDVSIQATRVRERLIARRIYLQDTQSFVRPGIQIPAIVIRIFGGLILSVVFVFLKALLDGSFIRFLMMLFNTLLAFLLALITPLIPYLVLGGGAWWYFRSGRRA